MNDKEFTIATIMAARKAEFYQKCRILLLRDLPKGYSKEEARLLLREAIRKLDYGLFVSEKERLAKTIDPETTLEDLKLDRKQIAANVLVKIAASKEPRKET